MNSWRPTRKSSRTALDAPAFIVAEPASFLSSASQCFRDLFSMELFAFVDAVQERPLPRILCHFNPLANSMPVEVEVIDQGADKMHAEMRLLRKQLDSGSEVTSNTTSASRNSAADVAISHCNDSVPCNNDVGRTAHSVRRLAVGVCAFDDIPGRALWCRGTCLPRRAECQAA